MHSEMYEIYASPGDGLDGASWQSGGPPTFPLQQPCRSTKLAMAYFTFFSTRPSWSSCRWRRREREGEGEGGGKGGWWVGKLHGSWVVINGAKSTMCGRCENFESVARVGTIQAW